MLMAFIIGNCIICNVCFCHILKRNSCSAKCGNVIDNYVIENIQGVPVVGIVRRIQDILRIDCKTLIPPP